MNPCSVARWFAISIACTAAVAGWATPAASAVLRPHSFTYHNALNLFPAWSPDGRRMVFSSSRESAFKGLVLWTSSADTDTAVSFSHGDWSDQGARYNPDGRTVLLMSTRTGSFNIYVRPADVDTIWPALKDARVNLYPCWFADGKRFVYASVLDDSGTTGLEVAEFPGGRTRELLRVKGPIYYPAVSPDQREVFFSSGLGGVNVDIYRISASGGSPVLWSAMPGRKMSPTFTPDGRHLLFARESGEGIYQLWVAPVDSARAAHQIDCGRPNAYYPAFSPDGKWIAFCSTDETKAQDIWIAPWTEAVLAPAP